MAGQLSGNYGLQLVVIVGEESRTLDLPRQGTLSVGRQAGCDVRIDDPSVSRRHALLFVGPSLVIEDLGGPNGTMIRDRAGPGAPTDTLNVRHLVGRRAELSVGDTLLFGTACVVVRRAPAAVLPDLVAPGDDAGARDPAMRAVYAQAALAAPTPINVLLLGETGVGKEVLARAIHGRSARAKGPFQAINCAAFNDSLLESELFGHEKGAFTGASQAREGLFEAAAGGTVFLDEVGELLPATQAKLLRAIEERVVIRVGGNRSTPIDVRLVAATNRDIEADCETGRFRQDLYFRLNGMALSIPPLRQRPLDIDHLAPFFLTAACRLIDRCEVPRISREASDCLRAYSWPGNVRELRNAMERAAVLCQVDAILPEHLPVSITRGREAVSSEASSRAAGNVPALFGPGGPPAVADLPAQIRSLERVRIEEALARAGGIQSEAARVLGISRRTLISRIEAYGLPRPRKREPKA